MVSRRRGNAWATCPLTENGFVRIYAQTIFKNHIDGVREAFFLLNTTKQTYRATHHFWSDSVSLSDDHVLTPSKIAGPNQITDVYLLGLCQKHGGTLVTFDTRLSTVAIVSPHAELLRILSTP
jgi:uncharacterized protein